MLSDVTMGQFFPGKSVMHRLDPRIKMCLTVYFIVLIFCSKNFVTLGATILMSLLGVVLSKVPLKLYLKSMKPILFIVVFTGVLNLFYGTGDPIFTLGFIHITKRYREQHHDRRAHRGAHPHQLYSDVHNVPDAVDGRH